MAEDMPVLPVDGAGAADVVVAGAEDVAVAEPPAEAAAEPIQLVRDFIAEDVEEVPREPALPSEAGSALLASNAWRSEHSNIAETVASAMGQNYIVNIQVLHLRREEIQRATITLPHAPRVMQERYDTQKNFTWCFGGFSLLEASFFPGGRRSPEAADILASCLEKNLSLLSYILNC